MPSRASLSGITKVYKLYEALKSVIFRTLHETPTGDVNARFRWINFLLNEGCIKYCWFGAKNTIRSCRKRRLCTSRPTSDRPVGLMGSLGGRLRGRGGLKPPLVSGEEILVAEPLASVAVLYLFRIPRHYRRAEAA